MPFVRILNLSITVLVHYRSLTVFTLRGRSPVLPTKLLVYRCTLILQPPEILRDYYPMKYGHSRNVSNLLMATDGIRTENKYRRIHTYFPLSSMPGSSRYLTYVSIRLPVKRELQTT